MAMSIYEDYARTSATRDGRVTIYVDSESDIANLSTDYAPGSRAYVVDGSSNGVYVLSPSGTWKAMPSPGGGGGGASVLVVNGVFDPEAGTTTLDKTAGEIFAAIKSGGAVYRETGNTGSVITSEDIFPFATASLARGDGYVFSVLVDTDNGFYLRFNASTENDYPTFDPGGEE